MTQVHGWRFKYIFGGPELQHGICCKPGVRYSITGRSKEDGEIKCFGFVQFIKPFNLMQVRAIMPYASWKIALGTPLSNRIIILRLNKVLAATEYGRNQMFPIPQSIAKKDLVIKFRKKWPVSTWCENIEIKHYFFEALIKDP